MQVTVPVNRCLQRFVHVDVIVPLRACPRSADAV
jgi:hypothetical protein